MQLTRICTVYACPSTSTQHGMVQLTQHAAHSQYSMKYCWVVMPFHCLAWGCIQLGTHRAGCLAVQVSCLYMWQQWAACNGRAAGKHSLSV
jgi:hypothetical protein